MPSTVTLRGFTVTEFSFANKTQNGTKIKLGNQYNYNVKYAQNNTCLGEMSVHVYDQNDPEKFFIKLSLRGVLTFDPAAQKEQLHIDSYKVLFPYARAFITTFSANAGIPPIYIPEADIESQSIYRFDLGGKPKSE